MIDTHICVNPLGKLVSDQGSQTIYLKYELSAKVESMVLRKDVFTTARYHYSNTDHGYHIRLGPKTLIAVMRTNCTISQVTLTAAGLVLPFALYHGLRNELILSSD